jgi:hypothetical protein
MANYFASGYADAKYVQVGITMDWPNRNIIVPRNEMTLIQSSPVEVRELDANVFRLALKSFEDEPEAMVFPNTHNNYPPTTVGGVTLARVIELINDYTVTFEDGQYAVNIVGANTNIADRVVVNQVSVRSANSAGLIQTREIEQASYNGRVYINTVSGVSGTVYPIGTLQKPVNNLTDAKFIAAQRGLDLFYLKSNLTLGATDDVTGLRFEGDGATLNVARTLVTLTQGCITTNSQWTHCKITGYQGGESLYHDCVIDGLDNAHCIYERCGLLDGTSRGYTIRQTSSVSSGHASYYKECYSDEATAIIDRNGARMNVTLDGFHGRIKFINQNHATSSGQVWIHLNGGTVTVDSTCTKGKITVTGFGTLVNNSLGTEVDASGFAAEVANQARLDVESLRSSHQGFGARWYVDPVNGNDLSPGTSPASPLRTVSAAITKAVSGRGDVIFLISPGSGTSTVDERIVLNKEDLHIRAPGRGLQIQPSTITADPVINITANNCSISGVLLRTSVGGSEDGIVVNAKFCRLENLYVVGPDAGTGSVIGTGVGVHFKGGDYHKVINCEIEKFGSDGVRFTDAPISSEGSPREVRFDNCNIYYNRGAGINFTGINAATTTRLNVVSSCRIQHNSGYGIIIGPYAQRTMIMSDNYIRDNRTYPTGTDDPTNEIYVDPLASDPMIDTFLIDIENQMYGIKHDIEGARSTHMGFGERFYVDPINGNDTNSGTTIDSPTATVTAALANVESGRGDVIYLLAPGAGVATLAERIVINKEDVHIRGPGRGIQFQPSSTDAVNPVIDITANNCSLSGFVVRSHASELTSDGIRVSGKFVRMEKLYLVGPGQTTNSNTCNGIRFTHGDYHELWDMEIEKYGGAAVFTDDLSGGIGNGSPREISVFGGNFYLNGSHGFHLHGATGALLGATTRIIRILKGANIHDNLSYGIHSQANVSGVVIDDSVILHDNNGGTSNPQVLLDGTGYYKEDYERLLNAAATWNSLAADYNTALTMGAKLNSAAAGGVDYNALADAVWDATATDHTTAGSTGLLLNQSAADIANALLQLITIASNPAATKEDIAEAVWDFVLEDTKTAQHIMRIQAAALAGKVTGAGTGTETFTGIDGTTIRIVSNVDTVGNRTAVAVNGT